MAFLSRNGLFDGGISFSLGCYLGVYQFQKPFITCRAGLVILFVEVDLFLRPLVKLG